MVVMLAAVLDSNPIPTFIRMAAEGSVGPSLSHPVLGELPLTSMWSEGRFFTRSVSLHGNWLPVSELQLAGLCWDPRTPCSYSSPKWCLFLCGLEPFLSSDFFTNIILLQLAIFGTRDSPSLSFCRQFPL